MYNILTLLKLKEMILVVFEVVMLVLRHTSLEEVVLHHASLVTEVVLHHASLVTEVVLHHASLVTEVVLEVVELHHASLG